MIRTKMKLYIVRDLQDGTVLHVGNSKEDAEDEVTYLIGTHAKGEDGEEIPTIPILECHRVTLGRLLSTTDTETVAKRVERRKVRDQASRDQMDSLWRDLFGPKEGKP